MPSEKSNYITLATHNKIVESTNLVRLTELQGEIVNFKAIITGNFPINTMPTDEVLKLKEGAQIMFIKNDTPTAVKKKKITKNKKKKNKKII